MSEETILTQKEVEPRIQWMRDALGAGGVEVIGPSEACALVHLGLQTLLEMGLVRESLVAVLRVAANAEMQRLAMREGIEWRPLGEDEP